MNTGHPEAGKVRTQRAGASPWATWKALFLTAYSGFPLMLPNVHALAGPVIMFRLKRMGYSNCRVVVKNGGLVVFADR
ncbi:MAG: hypothetical protein HXX11_12555 [Desulfuromonadales bacterium]|nr:hypothetical protein [Desulfuromonadales bacterium]